MKYIKTFEQKNITELDLCGKNLTILPELSNSLKKLYCHNNQLTELPKLPESLEYLYCSNNQLVELELPNSLIKTLYCDNNQLTELPELSDSIKLRCYNNKLPYDDLDGYKEWYAKTYPERVEANKYNI